MSLKTENKKKFKDIKSNLSDNSSSIALAAFKEVAEELQSALIALVAEDPRVHFAKKNANKNFNNLIQVCLVDVPPALNRVFNVEGGKIKNLKKHKKMEEKINSYLADVILLSKTITEGVARESIVKMGILPLAPFFKTNKKISAELVKQLVTFWSTGHDNLKVVSFMAIFKIWQSLPETAQESVTKSMYEAYIRNSRITSAASLSSIELMRASLTEMYILNEAIAYRQAFVYTRQMAIHIRNATTKNTEESIQIVYNWQFVSALHLWSEVLAKSHPSKVLQPLIHPVVQIAFGLMSVRKIPMYFPLVLTVCKFLITFARETKVFIPLLPYLLEILESGHWVKKKVSGKNSHTEWGCILRVSKTQLDEYTYMNEFLPLVIDSIKDYLSMLSNSVGFPELSFVATKNLQLVKKIFKGEILLKIKDLLTNIKSNSEFIEKRRAEIKFKFGDVEAVRLWEIETAQIGTPLSGLNKPQKKKIKNELKRKATQDSQTSDDDDSKENELKKIAKDQMISLKKRAKKVLKDASIYKMLLDNLNNYDSETDEDYHPPKMLKNKEESLDESESTNDDAMDCSEGNIDNSGVNVDMSNNNDNEGSSGEDLIEKSGCIESGDTDVKSNELDSVVGWDAIFEGFENSNTEEFDVVETGQIREADSEEHNVDSDEDTEELDNSESRVFECSENEEITNVKSDDDNATTELSYAESTDEQVEDDVSDELDEGFCKGKVSNEVKTEFRNESNDESSELINDVDSTEADGDDNDEDSKDNDEDSKDNEEESDDNEEDSDDKEEDSVDNEEDGDDNEENGDDNEEDGDDNEEDDDCNMKDSDDNEKDNDDNEKDSDNNDKDSNNNNEDSDNNDKDSNNNNEDSNNNDEDSDNNDEDSDNNDEDSDNNDKDSDTKDEDNHNTEEDCDDNEKDSNDNEKDSDDNEKNCADNDKNCDVNDEGGDDNEVNNDANEEDSDDKGINDVEENGDNDEDSFYYVNLPASWKEHYKGNELDYLAG